MSSRRRDLSRPSEICYRRITCRVQLFSWYLCSWREDENLNRTPVCIQVRARLFTQAQRFKLAVVKSKVLYQVLAHNHGPGFGKGQVFLGIAFHPGRSHDYRKAELILRKKVAASVKRLLVLQLRCIAAVEELFGSERKWKLRQT